MVSILYLSLIVLMFVCDLGVIFIMYVKNGCFPYICSVHRQFEYLASDILIHSGYVWENIILSVWLLLQGKDQL